MINEYLCSQTGVFVKDMKTEEIIVSHNADVAFPSASVIKLFILSYFAEKEDFLIPVSRKDMVGTSIITELKLSEVTMREALTYMICFSDNTATNLLINAAGMDNINAHIKELGCKSTVLARKMMDFKTREMGIDNYTSAEDCYIVMKRLFDMPYAREMLAVQKCRERLDRYIFGKVKAYTKPGDLSDVYNDVGVLVTPEGKTVFAAVFTHGLEKGKAKRLCGKTGLIACGAERPIF